MEKKHRLSQALCSAFVLAMLLVAPSVWAGDGDLPPPQSANRYMPVPLPSPSGSVVPNPLTLPGPPPVRNMLDIKQTKEIGGPFSLVDQDGNKVTEKDYEKYYKLIYFGYTNCPGVCPMALAKITQALDMLDTRADKIRVLFISTDPARDKPEVMKKYLANFKSDKIIGLTGSSDEIMNTENEFRIYAEGVNDPRMPSYTVNHSTIIYFTGFGKDLLEVMNTADSPAIMAGLIRRHLQATKVAKP